MGRSDAGEVRPMTTPKPRRGGRPRSPDPLVPVGIRVPRSLLPAIDAAAERDGRSRSAWILRLIREAVGK